MIIIIHADVRFALRMIPPATLLSSHRQPHWLRVGMKFSAKGRGSIPMIPLQPSLQESGLSGTIKEPSTILITLQVYMLL